MAAGPRGPPLKVLSAQLRGCRRGPDGAWLVERPGRAPLAVRAAWLQGTVLAARGGWARLQDSSGAFTVRGAERVPQGRPCLRAGNYVMVMGFVHTCTPEPLLQAVKMTDLSSNPINKMMWSLEVEDLQNSIP